MFDFKFKSLLVTLIVILTLSESQQTPLARNYSANLLRHAKSAEMLAYINPEFGYCDDFYKFACGNWKRTHPATSNETKTSYLGQIQELYKRKSIDMLKTDRHAERPFHQKLIDLFESCSNEVALARSGLEPVLKVVDFKGGWPRIIVPSWYEYEYNWLDKIAELRGKLGVDIFVGLEIVPDYEDKDVHRIRIGAPKFQLGSKDAYLKSAYGDEREEYMDVIAKKLRKYFSYMPAKWAYEVAKQILNIERDLVKGLPDSNPKLTPQLTTRKRYASEMKAAYGNYVDLSRYLMLVFNQTIQTLVYETPEDYMTNLVDVIKKTPKLHIANYTMWRVLEAFDFAGAINDEHNDNWCVERINEYFPNHLEDMFHSHFNAIPLHNEIIEVWKDIKNTFQVELRTSSHLNWMTQDTRNRAIDKLTAMTLDFEEHNNNELEYEMSELQFDKYKYYDNLLQVLNWHTKRQLAKLNKRPQTEPIPEYELPTYELTKNRIRVPIVFMQSRFLWDPAHPQALKYSTLGVLLAQQMLHGFDDLGREYGKHGAHRGWWDQSSEAAYNKREECLLHQYEDQKFKSQNAFKPQMLPQIVTFNGALGVAYRTYQDWKSNTPEGVWLEHEKLPKMYYDPEQLFFLGFAQMWCAAYDSEVKQFTELPERLRINGALANLPDFANEVKCQSNTKLNPTQKCVIY